jgi:hypothetical protein
MQFLSLGHGPWALYDPYGTIFGAFTPAPIQGQLAPWPGSPNPATISCTAGLSAPPVIVISNLTVTPGASVTLNATASFSPGNVALTTFSFEQTGGTNVMPVAAQALSTNTFTFTAPTTAQVLTFSLTVTDANGRASVKPVTVTIPAVAADILNIPATPTYRMKDGSWTLTVTGNNAAAAINMQAINDAGTVVLNLPMAQTPGQALWTLPAPTKFLVSPLPVRPGETLPRLTLQITSTKGAAVGPIGVVVRP